MNLFKTRQPITGEEKDKLVREIREKLNDLSEEDWIWYSHDLDFTVDELREFEQYINWNTYFIYCTDKRKANVTNKQILEFKDKDDEWLMIFQQRKVDDKTIRRWLWNYVDAVPNSWRWLYKFQNLTSQFKKDYKKVLKQYITKEEW